MQPQASIVIPTRNRRDLLRQTLAAAFAQSVPVEVIVMDDGSSDGTGQMIGTEFPAVRYERSEQAMGPSATRNRGATLASTNALFPIDDDAVFGSADTVARTLPLFDHPRVAAVGLPYVNVRKSAEVLQRAPDDRTLYCTATFTGAAHAVRRDRFLSVGGYREHFFYMGEEGDLTLRLLNAGYVTVLGLTDPVAHHESLIRNMKWADLYGRRNDVLTAWHNAPLAALPGRLGGVTLGGLGFGWKAGSFWRMVRGLAWGYGSSLKRINQRRPVDPTVYSLFRRLGREILPLEEIEPLLPPMRL